MLNFKHIIGHDAIINQFKMSIKNNKVSHAYLIVGEDDSGKLTLAKAFSMTLQCESLDSNACLENLDACGECDSCKQFISDNHPDVIYLHREDNKFSIGVDDIREQLVNDIEIKPYSSKYKIYIIDKAETLTPSAQNALLKTLEEPPKYAIIFLLTNNINSMLDTTISRCITLQVKAIDKNLIKDYLMSEYQIPDYQAELSATFAQGNLGKAINIASKEDFANNVDEVIKLLKDINNKEDYEIIEKVKNLSKEREDIIDILDLIYLWYADVLIYKVTKNPNILIYKNQTLEISKKGKTISYEGIQNVLGVIEASKKKIEANVDKETTLQLLLFTIKENSND